MHKVTPVEPIVLTVAIAALLSPGDLTRGLALLTLVLSSGYLAGWLLSFMETPR